MAIRYFAFIFPSDKRLQDLLNLAVYALDPSESWPAHITVAGPFSKKSNLKLSRKFDETVFCMGAGNFFRDGGTTVYLRIGIKDVHKIWRKPDFPGPASPHITLYNGSSSTFARNLFFRLEKLNPNFAFHVDGLYRISSKTKQDRTDLRLGLNLDLISETRGLQIDDIRRMPEEQRLEVAMKALEMSQTFYNL